MTIEIDDETVQAINDEYLDKDQRLTEITFHHTDTGIEVRLHFREQLEEGGWSAPAYESLSLE